MAKARFYDSDTGRFLSQDTYLGRAARPPSIHRYSYAFANPIVFVDPDGRDSVRADEEGEVYWNVEENWYLWNPDTRLVQIGTVDEHGNVKLSKTYGGYTVKLEELDGAADDFWKRYILDPQRSAKRCQGLVGESFRVEGLVA